MTDTTTMQDAAAAAYGGAAVALRSVTIQFERPGSEPLQIVDGYDLTLERGQMHCLAGRSGSGKTSILRVAAGLVPPAAGTVRWEGLEITGLADDVVTARRRTHIGYLDQRGSLVPGLTALENVLLPAVPDRRTRELSRRARDLLHRLGVGARATHYPERLSGGERQRVAFARALLLEPAIIMADEPTASLDRETADQLIGLLGELVADGIAVLVASHDPHLIEAAGSRTQLS
ncbi:ATP-binding cassette domain-containing protein [Microbacterium horticulturae]|uniref:ATP-binding cassette domain-containing protein n=1 Tax=Microbacterium horticulturae TaxID=3028316 RepID=A0ABY8BYQ6_9MICO|nr:ATP-binding cassette domain-containing protein [Microbacterium sp. KACC 23027]WEG09012.1 ATP-binding cassette domain-containing protein [Microbacterium sp. KACC 23027]